MSEIRRQWTGKPSEPTPLPDETPFSIRMRDADWHKREPGTLERDVYEAGRAVQDDGLPTDCPLCERDVAFFFKQQRQLHDHRHLHDPQEPER